MNTDGRIQVKEDKYAPLVMELLEASQLFEDVSTLSGGEIYVWAYDDLDDTEIYSLYKTITPYLASAEFVYAYDDDDWKDVYDGKAWTTYIGVVYYENPRMLF